MLGEVATERLLEGLRRELSAQSSRMMGSLVLAGWTGGTGNRGAPRGRSGRADFTFTGRLGRRAARRISRWLSALRRALGKERAAQVKGAPSLAGRGRQTPGLRQNRLLLPPPV